MKALLQALSEQPVDPASGILPMTQAEVLPDALAAVPRGTWPQPVEVWRQAFGQAWDDALSHWLASHLPGSMRPRSRREERASAGGRVRSTGRRLARCLRKRRSARRGLRRWVRHAAALTRPASARTASARHHRSARRHRPRRDIGAQDAAARMGRRLERIAVPSVGLTFPASLMALVVDRHQRGPLRCRRHRLTAPNPQQLAMAFDPELVAMRQLQRAQPRQDLIPRPPLRLRAIRPRRRGSGSGESHDGDPGRNDLRQGAPAQWHQSGSVVGQETNSPSGYQVRELSSRQMDRMGVVRS